MHRRSFLTALSSLPFLEWLKPEPSLASTPPNSQLLEWASECEDGPIGACCVVSGDIDERHFEFDLLTVSRDFRVCECRCVDERFHRDPQI